MKILHIVENIGRHVSRDGHLSPLLTAGLAEGIEVHVLTFVPCSGYNVEGVKFHSLDLALPSTPKFLSRLRATSFFQCGRLKNCYLSLLYDVMPDIVHLHGVESFLSSRLASWTTRRGFRLAVSAFALSESFRFTRANLLKVYPRILFYQRHTFSLADISVVESKKEKNQLGKYLFISRNNIVNKRTSLVFDPDSFSEMQQWALTLYNNIMFRNMYAQLSVAEQKAVCSLMHAGILSATEQPHIPSSSLLIIRGLSSENWRNVYIFAVKEDVLPIIVRGISALRLSVSYFRNITVDETLHAADMEELKKKFSRSSRIIEQSGAEWVEQDICLMMLNIRKGLRSGGITFAHLAQLYGYLRKKNYNEDHLLKVLRRLSLSSFSRRLYQVLQEVFFLEEGFMPVTPLNDRLTEKLRQKIIRKK